MMEHLRQDILLRMWGAARENTRTKVQAVQTVLNWGAALLTFATTLVLTLIGQGRDGNEWTQVAEWALIVLVTAFTAYQYAGELANMARSGAYMHRIEVEIAGKGGLAGVPMLEHWVQETQHWISPPLVLSAVVASILAAGAQVVPFVFGESAHNPPIWIMFFLGVCGVVISLIGPLVLGFRALDKFEKAMQCDFWSEAYAKGRWI